MHIYDKLLAFPLFQGMGTDDLERLVAKTRIGFGRLRTGETLALRGSPCDALHLLAGGELRVETRSDDGRCSLAETAHAPFTLPPDRLFGPWPRHASTYTATAPSSVISLGKDEVARLMGELPTFRINMLNAVAAARQKAQEALWTPPPRSVEEMVARFVAARCAVAGGRKELRMTMASLAAATGQSRRDVAAALHRLEAAGLAELGRGRVAVPSIGRLLSAAPLAAGGKNRAANLEKSGE